jgi:hypothetical protein
MASPGRQPLSEFLKKGIQASEIPDIQANQQWRPLCFSQQQVDLYFLSLLIVRFLAVVGPIRPTTLY